MRSSSVLFSQKFKERKGLYEKLWMLFSTKIEEGWVKNLKKRRVCLRNYGGLERHLRPSLHSQGNSVDGSPAFPPFPPTPTPVVQHQHQYHQHQRQHKRSNTNTHANTNTNDTLSPTKPTLMPTPTPTPFFAFFLPFWTPHILCCKC